MKGLVLGALFSAAVVFFWGFLFWNVMSGSSAAVRQAPQQKQLQAVLDEALPETGVYALPYSEDPANTEFQTLHTAGPVATIYIRKQGSEPMAPGTFLLGYFHETLVFFVMGLMLKVSGLQGYGARFGVVFLGGLAGSLFAHMNGPIWWLQPWDMATMNLIYDAFAWFFGALTLSAFVKPAGRRDVNAV